MESEDDWLDGLNIDESTYADEEIDGSTTADESGTSFKDADGSMASEFAADFAEEYSEPESYDDPSAVEDIAANLWEELDLEDSEEGPIQQSSQSESLGDVTEDTSASSIQDMALDFESEPEFTEEERTIQSSKSEFLAAKVDFNEDTQIANEQTMFAEMEFDEEDDDQPIFGAPIVKMNDGTRNRMILEYSKKVSTNLSYDKDKEYIVFDHLEPLEGGELGMYEYYVPSLSYDGLTFKNGKWRLVEDIAIFNSKKQDGRQAKNIQKGLQETR